MIKNEKITLDEKDYRPTCNKDSVSLGGWKFDISSTIYQKGACDEIISVWNLINDKDNKFVPDRLFQPFLDNLLLMQGTIHGPNLVRMNP